MGTVNVMVALPLLPETTGLPGSAVPLKDTDTEVPGSNEPAPLVTTTASPGTGAALLTDPVPGPAM